MPIDSTGTATAGSATADPQELVPGVRRLRPDGHLVDGVARLIAGALDDDRKLAGGGGR